MSEFISNGGIALILLGLLLVGTVVTLLATQNKEDQMVKPHGYFKVNTCIKNEPKTPKPNFTQKALKCSENKIKLPITCKRNPKLRYWSETKGKYLDTKDIPIILMLKGKKN